MSSKVGIFSDLHLHNFPQFSVPVGKGINSRAKSCLDTLDRIIAEAFRRKWDALLFCGDFFETREFMLTPLAVEGVKRIAQAARKVPVVMIRGNHDMATGEVDSPSSVDIFSSIENVHVLKNGSVFEGSDFWVCGFGAEEFDTEAKISRRNGLGILLLHDILRGSKSDNGITFEDGIPVSDVEDFMEANDISVCFIGDIHLRQRVKSEKHIRYVGNCIQKRLGEDGQKKGIHELAVSSRKVKFISVASPEFKRFGDEFSEKDYNSYNYFTVVISDRDRFRELGSQFRDKHNISVKYASPDIQKARQKAHVSVGYDPESVIRSYVKKRIDDDVLADRLIEAGKKRLVSNAKADIV